MLKRLKTTHFKPLQPYIPHNCTYIVPNHGAKSKSTAKKTALDKEFSHSPAAWGTVGRARPPSPLPRHGRAARQTPAEPQEARLLSAWQPPTAPASPAFLPRRSMADPARADRRQREAARAKQKELRICCEALLAVFFCPFAPGRRAFTFSGRAFRGKRRCADSSGCF